MTYVKQLLLTCAFSVILTLTLFAQNEPIIVQAESGTLGADFASLSQGGVQYVTCTTDLLASQNPGSPNRVASYTVTFPSAGTYDLFVKVRVGSGTANDDSFFYSNGFGAKSPTLDTDWITANQLAGVGWAGADDLISGSGSAGSGVWKWIRLSQFDGGEPPITFTVSADALTQTFHIGGREHGLDFDRIAFARAGLYFTVSQLDNGEAGSPTPPLPPPPPAPLPPVIVQAESGMLGAEFATGDLDGVEYIAATTTAGGGNPGSADRVVTYTVTFPRSGRYDLYARMRVGPGGGNDDSFFYGNGFGTKLPAADNDWIIANNLASVGFSTPTDLVNGPGESSTEVWKWIKLSSFNGGETPITFNVPSGALTQTFQIGRREDGLFFDQFAFGQTGIFYTVSNLDNVEAGTPFVPGPGVPIVGEAEFGALGSELTFFDASGVRYITPVGTTGGQNPTSANRVATYSLTFQNAGVYDLYVRVRVGAGAATDDSFYYGNGFGTKSPTNDNDWITANNLWNVGWSGTNDIITGPGTATTGVWKWIRLSDFNAGEAPVKFTVPEGSLMQTFQIGFREDGFDFDKFAFAQSGLFYTPGNLDNQETGSPTGPPTGAPIATGQPKFLGNVYSTSQLGYFTNYWNQVTPENAGKWGSAEPTRDVMNWGELDAAYNFAKANGFPFRFHVLVWGAQQPSWIESLPPAEQLEELREWFTAVATRYPDLDFVEVVNEPLHDPPIGAGNGNYMNALGGSGATGWDWILNAFRMAREIFPDSVKLMINEYSITNTTSDAQRYVGIVNLLKAENLIDIVGIQGHAFSTTVSAATTSFNLNLIANGTGLPIQITEMDVDGPTDATQLRDYQKVFPVFWEHPSVMGITFWGWKPGMWRTSQAAYLALHNGLERPALIWLRQYVENYKPVITQGQVFNVSENAIAGQVVDSVRATDPDTSAVFQNWQITGGTGVSVFAIDAASGVLTVAADSVLDYETTQSYTLIVRVGDGFTLSDPDTVTINILNDNDIAPVIEPATFTVNESASGGTVIGTMTATDGDDASDPGFTSFQQWQIVGGSGAGLFVIDDSTGVIALNNSATLDHETATGYDLMITVSDGVFTSAPDSVTIGVTNDNDNQPVITPFQKFMIDTWIAYNEAIGTVQATDKDDTNDPGFTTFGNWRITGGTGAWAFAINSNTGELYFSTSPLLNLIGGVTYSLNVTVSDGIYTSATTQVLVTFSERVDVCHRGRTQSVIRLAVPAHVRHGDTVGPCDGSAQSEPSAFEVYPNPVTPSTQQITVALGWNEFDIRKIELQEFSTGRIVSKVTVKDEAHATIPTANLKRGMYVLHMYGDQLISRTIIVE